MEKVACICFKANDHQMWAITFSFNLFWKLVLTNMTHFHTSLKVAPMVWTEVMEVMNATTISAKIVIVCSIWFNCIWPEPCAADRFFNFCKVSNNVPITFPLRFLLAIGLEQDVTNRIWSKTALSYHLVWTNLDETGHKSKCHVVLVSGC